MRLAPNEVAWLAQEVAQFDMTPHPVGTYAGRPRLAIAVAIAYHESKFDTDAINDRYPPNWDLGLWQMSSKWMWPQLLTLRWRDPFDNARMMRIAYNGRAKMESNGDGFMAWNVYKDKLLEPMTFVIAELACAHPWEPTNPQTTAWRKL